MKKFLLTFFKHNHYPGWENIAEKLIDSGECIVAGTLCIWYGGIGNYIKSKPHENAFNCSIYTFDLANFKESAWFKERRKEYVLTLQEEYNNRNKELTQLKTEIEELYIFQ